MSHASLLHAGPRTLAFVARDDDGKEVLLKTGPLAHEAASIARLQAEHELLSIAFEGVDGRGSRGLVDTVDGAVLVAEYAPGRTVRALLSPGPFSVDRFLEVATACARAVVEVHERGMIHLDLKPDNLIFDDTTGLAHVIDFGLASRYSRRLPTNEIGGTPTYMAPEQTGHLDTQIDQRADLYTLGVTMYEMLAGHPPFRQDDPLALFHAHVAVEGRALDGVRADIPPTLARVVAKLLQKAPIDRYQTVTGLVHDLEDCQHHWQQDRSMPDMALDQAIATATFQLRDHFGRTDELAVLRSTWDRARSGSREAIAVAGRAGIGRSHLVTAFNSEVGAEGLWLRAQCFDGTPPGAPLQAAVAGEIRGLLVGDPGTRAAARTRLASALGSEAGVLTSTIDDLGELLGDVPGVAELGPIAGRLRLVRAWRRLLLALSGPGRTLVLALDDLQWADDLTLSVASHLLETAEVERVFLLVTRRSDCPSPLPSVRDLPLEPWSSETLRSWITSSIDIAEANAERLTQFVSIRSMGYPLFALEILQTLVDQRLLRHDGSSWFFDADADVEMPSEIAELLILRLQALPRDAKQAVRIGAMIGRSFGPATVARLQGTSEAAVVVAVQQAVAQGLIAGAADGTLVFTEDRIHEAARQLTPPDDIASIHRDIGRDLRDHGGELFSVVGHLNAATALLDADERVQLASANLDAAVTASRSGGFDTALEHARRATELLDDTHWDSCFELCRDVALKLAETLYVTGDMAGATATCDDLTERLPLVDDQIKLARMRITLLISLDQYDEALAEGVKACALMGLRLPPDPGTPDLLRRLARAKWLLRGKQPGDLLHLPAITDPRDMEQVDLLMEMSSAAFLSNEMFAIVIGLELLTITLRRGLAPASPFGVMVYAGMSIGRGGYEDAYEWGEAALALGSASTANRYEARLLFVFGSTISHWVTEWHHGIELLDRAATLALDGGDANFADFALGARMLTSTCDGEPVDAMKRTRARYAEFFGAHRGDGFFDTVQGREVLVHDQFAKALTQTMDAPGSLSDDGFDEMRFRESLDDDLAIFGLVAQQLELRCVFGDFVGAAHLGLRDEKTIKAGLLIGDCRAPKFVFYLGLAAAQSWPELPGRGARNALDRCLKRVRDWAGRCPANFAAKHLLLEAERARLHGRHGDAMQFYERALASADNHAADRGIVAETAARFCAERGLRIAQSSFLAAARSAYTEWGAIEKVRILAGTPTSSELGHSDSGSTLATGSFTSERLTLESLLRASAAITHEIDLDKLLERLLAVAMESAGAHRGLILMGPNLEPRAERTGTSDSPATVARETRYSKRVADYVARARSPLILADAGLEAGFTDCPYVLSVGAKSIACVPLVNQETLQGLVYLENPLITGAFSERKLEMLSLLSAHAAIAIEKAQLFERQIALTDSASRFVPHEFLALIGRDSLVGVELGQQVQLEMTVLFSDIRDFTALVEGMSPPEAFAFINRYLSWIAPSIRSRHGIIEHYYGDGVMALFLSADDAVHAAIDMTRAVAAFNLDRQSIGDLPVRIGVGLHTGTVIVGIIGESERLQGSVIADAANLASRVEALTRRYAMAIAISGETRESLAEPAALQVREIDRVAVKGKREPVTVYEVFDTEPPGIVERRRRTRDRFAGGLRAIRSGDFDTAIRVFSDIIDLDPSDEAARVHLARAREYSELGPPDGWEGVEVMKTKR